MLFELMPQAKSHTCLKVKMEDGISEYIYN